MEELKPCPLCGGKVTYTEESLWIIIHHGALTPCGIRFTERKEKAFLKWNERKELAPEIIQKIDSMRRLLDVMTQRVINVEDMIRTQSPNNPK